MNRKSVIVYSRDILLHKTQPDDVQYSQTMLDQVRITMLFSKQLSPESICGLNNALQEYADKYPITYQEQETYDSES